jgi:hypothetical protein
LTDREREVLTGEADVSSNYVCQIRTRVREKLDRLADDLRIIETHHPDLLDEVELGFLRDD